MPSDKPHLIIFNPDQWRGDTLGHVGHPAVQTPVLDQFVRDDAVSFSAAFCQNTVCTPSRCSFMTGWYPHVRGHRTMHHMLHPEWNESNLLKILKDNGYFVWWGGKNDLVPGQHGFAAHCDVHFVPAESDYRRWGLTPRPGNHDESGNWRGDPQGDHFYSFMRGRLDCGGERLYADYDWATVLGALDFLRTYKGEQPLCIYLPLGYPHPPYGVEEPWFSLTDRSRLPARIPAPADWTGKPSILQGIWQNQHLQTWTEERWTELRATYYGMCARLDHQFGLLLNALRETGRYDDSAIFLFSDHGDFTGDYGLVEKTQNTFEDCLSRVPFIVKPPRTTPVRPRVCDALVELVDFPATVYELAGINPGYDHFGRSLLPLLAGTAAEHRDAVFCEGGRRRGERQAMELESAANQLPTGFYYPRLCLQRDDSHPYHTKAAMCRTRTHKYVMRLYESDELYDLTRDPGETRNLIDHPDYRPLRCDLRQRLLTWYMETADVVPHTPDRR